MKTARVHLVIHGDMHQADLVLWAITAISGYLADCRHMIKATNYHAENCVNSVQVVGGAIFRDDVELATSSVGRRGLGHS